MTVRVITQHMLISDWMRELLERRMQRALDRFAHRIGEVSMTFEDVNGPRGGKHIQCRLRLLLHPRGEINVAAVNATAYLALRDAIQRAKRRVKMPSFAWKRDAGWMSDRFEIRGQRLRPKSMVAKSSLAY